MTLIKYTPSATFRQRLLERTGYSLSNPHHRQSVINRQADRINALQQGRDQRADMLRARHISLGDRVRNLALALAVPVAVLLSTIDQAQAGVLDERPGMDLPDPISTPAEPDWMTVAAEIVRSGLERIDWAHPGFVLGVGAGLLLTQIVAISQRRHLVRSMKRIEERIADHSVGDVPLEAAGAPLALANYSETQAENEDAAAERAENIDDDALLPTTEEAGDSPNSTKNENKPASEPADNGPLDSADQTTPVIEEPSANSDTGDADTASLENTGVELIPEPDVSMLSSPRCSWNIDAATRKGQIREENQDHFATLDISPNQKVLIVCDGAGGIKGGREASVSAVEAIRLALTSTFLFNGALEPDDLLKAIDEARLASARQQLSGVTTALVVLLKDDTIHYATLGDGAVSVIWPDAMVSQLQAPHHTAGQPSNIINAYIGHGCDIPPRIGSCRFEPGSIVMAMTDGVSDLFPFEEFALQRDEYGDIEGLADHLLTALEAARDPISGAFLHHDNMTLAMARLIEGGDHE